MSSATPENSPPVIAPAWGYKTFTHTKLMNTLKSNSIGRQLWYKLCERNAEDKELMDKLLDHQAILFLPTIPFLQHSRFIELGYFIYHKHGTTPLPSGGRLQADKMIFGPLEVSNPYATAVIVNEFVSFTPTENAIAGEVGKNRSIRILQQLAFISYPLESSDRTIPIIILMGVPCLPNQTDDESSSTAAATIIADIATESAPPSPLLLIPQRQSSLYGSPHGVLSPIAVKRKKSPSIKSETGSNHSGSRPASPRRFSSLTMETFKKPPASPLSLGATNVLVNSPIAEASPDDDVPNVPLDDLPSDFSPKLNKKEELGREAIWEDLIKYLRSFTQEFGKSCQMLKYTGRTLDDHASEEYQHFLDYLQAQLQGMNHLPGEMDLEDTMEWIEQFLSNELYSSIFSPSHGDDRTTDQLVSSRISALRILNMDITHLGVSVDEEEREALESLVTDCSEQLLKMDQVRTPKDKLESIASCHRLISESLNAQDGMEGRLRKLKAGADTILPLLIYILVRSNPPRIISNIRFVRRFRREHKIQDYYSYCLTNMQAAISFLETADLQAIGLTPVAVETNFVIPKKIKEYLPAMTETRQKNVNVAVQQGKRAVDEMGRAVTGVVGIVGKWWTSSSERIRMTRSQSEPNHEPIRIIGDYAFALPNQRYMECRSGEELEQKEIGSTLAFMFE